MHGHCSHSTDECRDLKRMLDDDEQKPAAKRPRFANKTWQRTTNDKKKSFDKDRYNKYKNNSELNAFILKATRSAVRSELESFFTEREQKEANNTEAQEDNIDIAKFNKLDLSDSDDDNTLSDDELDV